MKLEFVLQETKEIYPNMNDEEIENLINEALQQQSIQEMIVNYICYAKNRLGK